MRVKFYNVLHRSLDSLDPRRVPRLWQHLESIAVYVQTVVLYGSVVA
jgi:hypothetical protein